MPIQIGDFKLRNDFLLAPMSGVSDIAFRQMAWKLGAGLVVSEMVASEAFVTGLQEMELKSASAGLPVHMVQLSGRDPVWMAKAARMAEANGATIIDINMGCPSRRVTNGDCGSALMRDLDLAVCLIDSVIEAVNLPVTLKMRLGWDERNLNAPELARRAVNSGVQMITVHGRTRNQFYKGRADWKKVRAVREAVDVPLVVNGDITDLASARTARQHSGADAVMIGRACYGAPWLPGYLAHLEAKEKLQENRHDFPINPGDPFSWGDVICEHYEKMMAMMEPRFAIRHARKHIAWYLDHATQILPDAGFDNRNLRLELMRSEEPAKVLKRLEGVFSPVSDQKGSNQSLTNKEQTRGVAA